MRETISPAKRIEGVISLPGDKSISHRYGMLAGIAEGRSRIANYSTGADCQSTLGCMAALGARIGRDAEGRVVVQGGALRESTEQLDAGNSGSTIRCSPESWRRRASPRGSAATNRFRAAPWLA